MSTLKIRIISLLLIVHFQHLAPQQKVTYNTFTQKVFKHFYCIQRLTKTMKFMSQMDKLCQQKISAILLDESPSFKNKFLITMIQDINTQQSINPVISMWESICFYRHLDEEFFNEFTQILVIMYKAFFVSMCLYHRMPTATFDRISLIISEALAVDSIERLEYIDFLTKHASIFTKERSHTPFSENIYKPTTKTSYVDAIAHRYYIIERLKKPFNCLKKLFLQPQYFEKVYDKIPHILPMFHGQPLLWCMQEITDKKSFKSFVCLWDELCYYKYIDDETFAHEFALIILILLQEITLQLSPQKTVLSEHNLHETFQYIVSLPLEDILQAIDTLSTELVILLQKYELNNSHISWKEWFKRYWWTPPIIAATITIKILIIYKMLQTVSPCFLESHSSKHKSIQDLKNYRQANAILDLKLLTPSCKNF